MRHDTSVKTFNIVSGILFLPLAFLEAWRILMIGPWIGMNRIAHLGDILLLPMWLAAAAVLVFSRRANEHYIFLWAATLGTAIHGIFVVLAGNVEGFYFIAGAALVGVLQGLRIRASGTSAIEKMYGRPQNQLS